MLQVEPLEERAVPASGTWTELNNAAPDAEGIQTMMLLPNGTVIAQGGSDDASSAWYALKPDSTGSYINGSWSTLASMSLQRLFFGSAVLTNGEVMVYGGEYSGNPTNQTFVNSGEIYNPATNTWSAVATIPAALDSSDEFGDDPLEVLSNGNVLAGYLLGPQTFLYNPTTNTWSAGGTKLNNDQTDEETWVKMANGNILSYDIFNSAAGTPYTAQSYDPSTNTWSSVGDPDQLLSDSSFGDELGPAFLLPNGNVIYVGANTLTDIYDPSTDSWSAGPSLPANMGADDASGAELPNGDVIFAADTSSPADFTAPTELFYYSYASNTLTQMTTPAALTSQLDQPAFNTRTLMLPTGQLLLTTCTDDLWIYTPPATAQISSSQSTLTSLVSTGGNSYILTGTQLNGSSEGATYGDDAEAASNYPIVQLTDPSGNVTYGQTSNWSTTGVQTGATPETVDVTLPGSLSPNVYLVGTSASGVTSTNDVLYIQMGAGLTNVVLQIDSATGDLQLVKNGVTQATEYAPSSILSTIIQGGTSADTLTVDYANGDPLGSSGLIYNGGTSGNNSLKIVNGGTLTSTVKWSITSANTGTVNVPGGITFSNVQNLGGGSETDDFVFVTGASESGVVSGGGQSTDTLDYSGYAAANVVNVNLSSGTATLTGGANGFGNIIGNANPSNSFTGSNTNNTWTLTSDTSGTATNFSYSGFESLGGGSGNDVFNFNGFSITGSLNGGGGSNTLIGPNTAEIWTISGANQGTLPGVVSTFQNIQSLTGGSAMNKFIFENGSSLGGQVNGGSSGTSWLIFSPYQHSIKVNLATGANSVAAGGFVNFNDIIGSAVGGDTITGSAAGGVIVAHAGGNTIYGGAGNSLLIGGYGKNYIIAGGGGNSILINGCTGYNDIIADLMTILGAMQITPVSALSATLKSDGVGLFVGTSVILYPPQSTTGPRFGRGAVAYNSILEGNSGVDWFFTASQDSIVDEQPDDLVSL